MAKLDCVNHPEHYTSPIPGIEVIDITKHLNFCLGNVIKYVLRCDYKGTPIEDLRKAMKYIEFEIKRREDEDTGTDNCEKREQENTAQESYYPGRKIPLSMDYLPPPEFCINCNGLFFRQK